MSQTERLVINNSAIRIGTKTSLTPPSPKSPLLSQTSSSKKKSVKSFVGDSKQRRLTDMWGPIRRTYGTGSNGFGRGTDKDNNNVDLLSKGIASPSRNATSTSSTMLIDLTQNENILDIKTKVMTPEKVASSFKNSPDIETSTQPDKIESESLMLPPSQPLKKKRARARKPKIDIVGQTPSYPLPTDDQIVPRENLCPPKFPLEVYIPIDISTTAFVDATLPHIKGAFHSVTSNVRDGALTYCFLYHKDIIDNYNKIRIIDTSNNSGTAQSVEEKN